MIPARDPVIRRAARALIVDARGRVLLFHGELPDRPPWWFAPGGALEEGETYEAAVAREVTEETGLEVDVATLPPPVWTRNVLFTWNGVIERHLERFFLIRLVEHTLDAERFEPAESEILTTHRWWALDEIMHSSEPFAPRHLGQHLASLLTGMSPGAPLDVGE
jgi:8-oxo-dGTP pyrophosphatase MutT (NUDIX family)